MATFKVRSSGFLLAWMATVVLTACDKSAAPLRGTVSIDGSTTVFPLSKAVAQGFRKSNPAVRFTVDFSGTGGGFQEVLRWKARHRGCLTTHQRGGE